MPKCAFDLFLSNPILSNFGKLFWSVLKPILKNRKRKRKADKKNKIRKWPKGQPYLKQPTRETPSLSFPTAHSRPNSSRTRSPAPAHAPSLSLTR